MTDIEQREPLVCECTKIEQDETCPVGYPSLLCDVCDGKGVVADVKPFAYLAWKQGRIAIDDVVDYYEVVTADDKCVDGSPSFPVYTGQQLAEVEARAELAEAMFAEIEAALDAKEIASGLTSDGNLWRFWSQKAKDVVAKLSEAEARVKELEAENQRLKRERRRVDNRIREQRCTLRWWQDHFNMHVSHASRRRLVALGWKWRIIEHYRQMKTVRITVKDIAAIDRATTAEAETERLRALVEEANRAEDIVLKDAKLVDLNSNGAMTYLVGPWHLDQLRAARALRDRLGVEE